MNMESDMNTLSTFNSIAILILAALLIAHADRHDDKKLRLLDENIRLQQYILDRPLCSGGRSL